MDRIFFPFPKRMVKRPTRGYGRLLITFSGPGLQRAARRLNKQASLLNEYPMNAADARVVAE
jgi:hypothetical protein